MPGHERFQTARAVLQEAVPAAFPGCVAEVGHSRGVLWHEPFGSLDLASDRLVGLDTIYDLASLTKVIATTTLVSQLSEADRLPLDRAVRQWLRHWRGDDRSDVTVRDLLAHASGLTGYVPFYRDCQGRPEFEAAICDLPLEYRPRTQSIYSDLGFILLGFIIEEVTSTPFAVQFERACRTLQLDGLRFGVGPADRVSTAPTGHDPWRGRHLVGEVHDANAWALGGAAGHAGLFGTAAAVGGFARRVLRALRVAHGFEPSGGDLGLGVAPHVIADFARRSAIPGSSRALGWDTMLPTSSCGRRMSPTAIGHTGFTGTSLWIDWERDCYVVLLSNRVECSPPSEAILAVRPAFHDAVVEALGAPAPPT